jgi:hypothetical protein
MTTNHKAWYQRKQKNISQKPQTNLSGKQSPRDSNIKISPQKLTSTLANFAIQSKVFQGDISVFELRADFAFELWAVVNVKLSVLVDHLADRSYTARMLTLNEGPPLLVLAPWAIKYPRELDLGFLYAIDSVSSLDRNAVFFYRIEMLSLIMLREIDFSL